MIQKEKLIYVISKMRQGINLEPHSREYLRNKSEDELKAIYFSLKFIRAITKIRYAANIRPLSPKLLESKSAEDLKKIYLSSKLIQLINKKRNEAKLACFSPKELELKSIGELKQIYFQSSFKQPRPEAASCGGEPARHKQGLKISAKSIAICIIILGLFFFIGFSANESGNTPGKNITAKSENTSAQDSGGEAPANAQDAISIEYGLSGNQTVYLIKNKFSSIDSMNVFLDGDNAAYFILIGKLPAKQNEEIGVIINDTLCDGARHEAAFVLGNLTKNAEFTSLCMPENSA